MLAGLSKDKLILDTTALDDSDNVGAFVRASDGTLITHTTSGGKQALDVNIVASPDSGIFAEDSPHTSGDNGQFILAVRHDANTAMVDTDGDYSPLQTDSQGRLKVAAVVSVEPSDAEYAEDSASADGETLIAVAAVRQDALASSLSTDGDHGWLKLDARGAMWVAPVGTVADGTADNERPVKVGARALAGPLAATASGNRVDMIADLYRRLYVNTSANVAILAAAASVTDTAAIIAAALGGRRTIMVSNRGNKAIYIGSAAVTAAAGFVVSAGATISVDLGQNVDLYAIADTGVTVACRVLQLA